MITADKCTAFKATSGTLIAAVALLLAGLSSGGCAAVKPWQRGVLAKRCMQWAPSPEVAAHRQHVLAVRESAQGGHGSAGGGCGCD